MDGDAAKDGPGRTVVAPRPSPPGDLPPSGDPVLIDPAEHNVVFTSLVTSDKDIVGLVAYSIYKQNKYDWLTAFGRQQGRMPNDAEAQSYLLGESTSRRLATYRHLAEATLEGRGVDVPGGASGRAGRPFGFGLSGGPDEAARTLRPPRTVMIGIILAILALILLVWAYHAATTLPARL